MLRTAGSRAAARNPWDGGNARQAMQALRERLYAIPEVREFTRSARAKRHSAIDLAFGTSAWFLGIGLVAAAGLFQPWQAALGTASIVFALTCVSSLTHESWHSHLSNSRELNDLLSRWILSPLLFADFEEQQRKHLMHHAYLGEDDDPERPIYRMSTAAFVGMLVKRALVVPIVLGILRRTDGSNKNMTTAPPLSREGLMRIALIQGAWLS